MDARRRRILKRPRRFSARAGITTHRLRRSRSARSLRRARSTCISATRRTFTAAVILEKMNEVVGRLEAALSSDASAKACLRAAVHALFAYHDSNRPFFEIFLHQHQLAASPLNERHWKEMEDLKRRNLGLIEDCVARGQTSGELKAGQSAPLRGRLPWHDAPDNPAVDSRAR